MKYAEWKTLCDVTIPFRMNRIILGNREHKISANLRNFKFSAGFSCWVVLVLNQSNVGAKFKVVKVG